MRREKDSPSNEGIRGNSKSKGIKHNKIYLLYIFKWFHKFINSKGALNVSISREEVIKAITFQKPSRLVFSFPEKYGTDFAWASMDLSPDKRLLKGKDEWGAVWDSMGESHLGLGKVKEFPLKDWEDFKKMKIPDIEKPERWEGVKGAGERANGKFVLGEGISIYERLHFLRGLENTWVDIYENRNEMCKLLDILVDMNLYAIDRYSREGVNGFIFFDDWGLQDRLMISPKLWREIWKPRYKRIYDAVHKAGMYTFLHSCGYIVEILGDLIEIGLDVINMDQQENMGLALLSEKFAGKITFYSPVDIQKTMVYGTMDEIREYCRKMVRLLGRPEGGFIAKWYSDPVGAGHTQETIETMCDEFLKISREVYGN
jgi:hypothetical protein